MGEKPHGEGGWVVLGVEEPRRGWEEESLQEGLESRTGLDVGIFKCCPPLSAQI